MTQRETSKKWRCPYCGQANAKSALQSTYEKDLASGTPLYGEETCFSCLESISMAAVYGGEHDMEVTIEVQPPRVTATSQQTAPSPLAPAATSLPIPPKGSTAPGQGATLSFERVLCPLSTIPYFKLTALAPDHLDTRGQETYLNDLFDFNGAMEQGDLMQAELILNYLVDDNPRSVPLWLNKAIVKSAKVLKMSLDQELVHDIIYYLEKAIELNEFREERREVALALADIIASAAALSNFDDSFLYGAGTSSTQDLERLQSVAAARQAFTYLSQRIRDLAN